MHDLSKHTAGDNTGRSPFDQIRRHDERGEYWSARELMPLMGYTRWQTFEVPIRRAMRTAENTGIDVTRNFTRSRKVFGAAGPAQEDYLLSRQACYLVAMNGDPNKPEVAAAQAYFAGRTVEAETAEANLAGMPEWVQQQMATLIQIGKIEVEQARQRDEQVRQLERIVNVESRMDGIEGKHGWWSALGYSRKHKLNTSLSATKALGKAASRICRERGIEPDKTDHEHFGEVGLYPEDVLAEAARQISQRA